MMVSVCMITYNQEKYIAEAIEGVLMQQTGFPVELIIGEDCSTDNTRNICLEYKEKHPDFIKLLLPEKNLGIMPNFIATLNACTGKYIALCEGDDYWIDPNKLQKQVDFLEANEDFSTCFHQVRIKKEHENIIVDDDIIPEVSNVTDIYKLARWNYIHTPSVVFRRNEDVLETMSGLNDLCIGDYVIFMLNAKYGMIKKLPEEMAVYRTGMGVWTSEVDRYRLPNSLLMLDKLIKIFEYDNSISYSLNEQYRKLAFTLYNILKIEKEYDKAYTLFQSLCANHPNLVHEEYKIRMNELNYIKNTIVYRFGKYILKISPLFRKRANNIRDTYYINQSK